MIVMPKLFSAAGPHEVHQLLVSVSKHYLIGARGNIRYQKKTIDVSLRNYIKSDREHIVYYILRDRFSGFYYVEVASTKHLVPLQDFLLRAFLPKPDIYFGGMPRVLMVPKDVEAVFPQVDELLSGLKIAKVNPPSGFDSGISAVKDWERMMKIPVGPDGLDNIKYWNPRTSAHYLDIYNSENHERWKYYVPEELFMPNDEFVMRIASDEFKNSAQYPLYVPDWKRAQTSECIMK